jgi:hypothetical protein
MTLGGDHIDLQVRTAICGKKFEGEDACIEDWGTTDSSPVLH